MHWPEFEQFDMLTVNCLYVDIDLPLVLSEAGREAIRGHLKRGRPLLAIHASVISFGDWHEWGDTLGASWVWGQSSHPDFGPTRITVHRDADPIVADIADFELEDEVYGFLDVRPGVNPLFTGIHGYTEAPPGLPPEPAQHPLLWLREVDGARVAVDLLGHAVGSFSVPQHRVVLTRAVQWLLA